MDPTIRHAGMLAYGKTLVVFTARHFLIGVLAVGMTNTLKSVINVP
jgi:hypothetical protein